MISDENQLEYSPATMLSIDEAAQRMGVDDDVIEGLIQNGVLHTTLVDGEVCINVAMIDLYTSSLVPHVDSSVPTDELI